MNIFKIIYQKFYFNIEQYYAQGFLRIQRRPRYTAYLDTFDSVSQESTIAYPACNC